MNNIIPCTFYFNLCAHPHVLKRHTFIERRVLMFAGIDEQYDKLYRYCYYRLHDVQTAEDITQEAFLKLLKTAGTRKLKIPWHFYTQLPEISV